MNGDREEALASTSPAVLTPEQVEVALSARKNRFIRESRGDRFVSAMCSSPLFEQLWRIDLSNDPGKLESEAVRHHFVPQFTLKEFAIPGQNQIGQLNIESGGYVATSIEGAASRRRLYQSEFDDGESHNQIEGYLSIIESAAAPAIQRLIDDSRTLDEADRATLSLYFAVQMLRTPTTFDVIEKMHNATFCASAEMMLHDLERFKEFHEKHDGKRLTDQEASKLRDDLVEQVRTGQWKLDGKNGATAIVAIEIASNQSPTLFGLEWIVLHSNARFITSDRAYSIYDPEPRSPWSSQAPIGSARSETVIPLTPDCCVLMRPGRAKAFHQPISDEDADVINLRTYAWGESYMFGASEARLMDVRSFSEERDLSPYTPRPHMQPHILEIDPDDDSLVEENKARGWPGRISLKGVEHDYIVVDVDNPDSEQMARLETLGKARAAKRLGLSVDSPELVPGGVEVPRPDQISLVD